LAGLGAELRKRKGEKMNIFTKIASGFVWIGQEIGKAVTWLPKIIKLSDDVKTDAATLLPELAQVVEDVSILAKAAVTDSAADLASAEALIAAIGAAARSNALNIAADIGVVAALEDFIQTVTNSSNYADVIAAVKTLVVDYDKFGASAKLALGQLEKDAIS
jgi:hypothetical protein